jgi:MFS family permease
MDAMPATVRDDKPVPTAGSLRDPAHRLPTLGIVVVVTVVAVEAMAVATVMPTVAHALHGLKWYGWTFTAYFLADVVGMVDAGPRSDRSGPLPSLAGGLGLFAAGLLTAGLAPDMGVFVLGRTLQGLGGGSLIVAVYVVVARAFPERLRPRVFAILSAAWVLPALVGPAAAGAVADSAGWRWVFLGIAPLALAGAAMLVPALAGLRPGEGPISAPRLTTLGGIGLAAGLGLVQIAGQSHDPWSPALAVVGLAFAAWPLRRLLPGRTLRLRAGLPTVIVLRGLLSAGFFGAEAYLPLTLTRLHGGTPTEVGIPLTVSALGWAAGSWWQGRRAGSADPRPLLRSGFFLVATGVAALVIVTVPGTSLWVAAPIWAVAGTGMGLALTTVSVLTLSLSPEAEQGANSTALQVCDVVGSVLGVAVAATVVAVSGTAHFAAAIRVVDPVLAAVGLVGMVLCRRAVPSGAVARAEVRR